MNFLSSCNSGNVKVDESAFREVWCKHCSNVNCDLADYAKQDKMAVRARTWEQRYFGTPQADGSHPLHAIINRHDFPNLLHKAVVQEISERRGDWSVPDVNLEALSAPLLLTPQKSPPVEEQELLQEDLPPEEELQEEPLSEEEPPPVVLPKGPVPPVPTLRNVPRSGPQMIGGAKLPETVADPWAPPPVKAVVIKAGAKVQFDKDGKLILP